MTPILRSRQILPSVMKVRCSWALHLCFSLMLLPSGQAASRMRNAARVHPRSLWETARTPNTDFLQGGASTPVGASSPGGLFKGTDFKPYCM